MTHDFVIYFSEIIDFPLRFCWYSRFANKNQIYSGIDQFFDQKRVNSPIFGFSTFFQNLSGNEIILRKIIEKFVNYAHQSELNLVSSAKIKHFRKRKHFHKKCGFSIHQRKWSEFGSFFNFFRIITLIFFNTFENKLSKIIAQISIEVSFETFRNEPETSTMRALVSW